ncbi:MAG TPA: S8 family serine peptidase [Actinoplanes sp.]|nr:S8 family serine peptidase [Actinoplanes sp.]
MKRLTTGTAALLAMLSIPLNPAQATAATVPVLPIAAATAPVLPAGTATGPASGATAPALPTEAAGCVGASPVTMAEAPWTQRRMAPQNIWPLTRGKGVTVAVVDSGVSVSAIALRGGVLPGKDVSGGAANDDCAGRGTALAGIVAARAVTGTAFAGMAPEALILPIRVTDTDSHITAARVAEGIRAASSAGAGIILVGTGVPADTPKLAAAVEAATARGALVIASVAEPASGGTGQVTFPAAYPEVLAVNDVAADGTVDPVADGVGLDLLAPGTGAYSIAPHGPGHYTVSGAAVAAAYVAGTAALARGYHPQWSAAEVRARLLSTTDDRGVVDPYAAVAALAPSRGVVRPPVGQAVTVPETGRESPATRRAAIVMVAAAFTTALLFAAVLTVRYSRARRRLLPRDAAR